MVISKERKKFLKKIKNNTTIDMVEFTKKILPYEMLGYDSYEVLTYLNRNQSTKPIKKDDLLGFYKYAYDVWFDYISQLNENNYCGKTYESIIKIKTEERFKKNNMTPEDCEKFIFEGYDKEFSESGLRFLQSQRKEKVDEDFSDFVHVFPFGRPGNIDCRLYLNLKSENILELGKILAKKCFQKHFRIYYKFWTGMNERNDTFLIYTNYNRVQDIIDILKETKSEKPEIFDGAEKSNGLLLMIDGFIGFGEDPSYKHSSFNSERADALDEFFDDSFKKQANLIGNYTGTIHNLRGADLNLQEYLKYLLNRSFLETVHSRQTEIMNKHYPKIYKTNEQIKDYIEIQTKIYKACKNKVPNSVEKQIDDNVVKVIERLKSGNFPSTIYFTFKTQKASLSNFSEGYAKEVLKKYGSLDYHLKLDLNLREKLFSVFDVKNKMEKDITATSLKPYFEKHHVSFDFPYLNTDDVIEKNKG